MNQAQFLEEEVDKHPSIPPNCEYFKNDDGWYFDSVPLSLIGKNSYADFWRPIIAAVAEVAWMKESRKYCEYLMPNERLSVYKEWNICYDNATAWRIWGESK